VLLAYELNGRPLPPQHGFPLRLVVPGWYGMTNVKWLERITVLDRPFEGYQHEHSYRLRASEDDPGTPVDRMLPRALMVPPGIPEFLSRERIVEPGQHLLRGRAWSGSAKIASVEVSTDGGAALDRLVGGVELDSETREQARPERAVFRRQRRQRVGKEP
jgi:sulfane dehydrogenase subunit SoxC